MALISPKKPSEKEKIKIEINKDIYHELQEYCSWAGIDQVDYFFEESATMIFGKDKDWKKFKKEKNKETAESTV